MVLRYKAILAVFVALLVSLPVFSLSAGQAQAQSRGKRHAGGAASARASVYPQFRSPSGVIRWISDQMPLKVYISPGLTLDGMIDPQLGAPYASYDNRDHWPDLVAEVVQDPQKFQALSQAQGYSPGQLQAAIAGINEWKQFEPALFTFQIVDDPSDADIYFFWTNHFVNKLGMGLFGNDVRGWTAKRSFWYKQIMNGAKAQFRPVVSILRTTESDGSSVSPAKMKARAAHEFGHALGIEGHSTNPNDLMSVYYGHGVISASDAATIRYLYHVTPDLIP